MVIGETTFYSIQFLFWKLFIRNFSLKVWCLGRESGQRPKLTAPPNSGPGNRLARLFYFYIFLKKNYRNIFWFSKFTVLYPTARQEGGRGPTAPLLGGRDLFANKNKIYLRINPWWGLPPPCRAAGPLPPSGGAAGTCT